jgi:DNA polymerase-3 subunit chi
VKVDFYQLGDTPIEAVIASVADKLLATDERILIVSTDEGQLVRLDRQLWNDDAFTFRPHGLAGGPDDARQPVLLSTSVDAPNSARNLVIADGEWREAALSFDRAFYLFDDAILPAARAAWKALTGRDGVERRFWASEGGKWAQKG